MSAVDQHQEWETGRSMQRYSEENKSENNAALWSNLLIQLHLCLQLCCHPLLDLRRRKDIVTNLKVRVWAAISVQGFCMFHQMKFI